MRLQIRLILLLLVVCCSIEDAGALSITVGKQTPRGYRLAKEAVILSGPIVPGDYAQLVDWLRRNRNLVVDQNMAFVVDSPGGLVSEALRIGELLSKLVITVWIPPPLGRDRDTAPVCVSACFVLVVGAPHRMAWPESVGLHRPYFDPKTYSTLDMQSARTQYDRSLGTLKEWLRERSVPNSLIDAMLSRSSRDVYWLTHDDMELLGSTAPWLEEFAIARCGLEKDVLSQYSAAVERGDTARADRLKRQWDEQASCFEAMLRAHREAIYADPEGVLRKADEAK